MHILCAPDSFKGSLSSPDVAKALATGLAQALPDAVIRSHPLSDGGEGTLEVLCAYGFELVERLVKDQLGRGTMAFFAHKAGVAVIESAQASGFDPHATSVDAREASSYGVGELIAHALEAGASHIMLTVGGTSTTDGGVGMLQALGFDFLTSEGHPIPPGGEGLNQLAEIRLGAKDPRLEDVTISVLTDVDNPLLGPEGAAQIFAPQKGADPIAVAILEQGLTRLSSLAPGQHAAVPGAGAGGGMGFAAMAFLGAHRVSGALAMMELTGFDEALEACDVVITGEGSFDDQSLHGKIPAVVIEHASARGIPVYVVCGVDRLANRGALGQTTIHDIVSLSELEPDPFSSIANAAMLLTEVGSNLGSRILDNGLDL
jgi:glycerate kinase